jgi:hypothetical protein
MSAFPTAEPGEGPIYMRGEYSGIKKFDENKPHTLADFVAESMKCGVVVEGLPEGVTPREAAAVFGQMSHVELKPLAYGEHYFFGWFPIEGKKVETNDDAHLFTIISTELLTKGHRLIIEPAAKELLKK